MPSLPVVAETTLHPAASHVFMTFAVSAHPRNLGGKPRWIAAPASWGIALFQYRLQVPAIRLGDSEPSPGQRRSRRKRARWRSAFRSRLYMREPLKLDVPWARRCLVGAVSFMFRSA